MGPLINTQSNHALVFVTGSSWSSVGRHERGPTPPGWLIARSPSGPKRGGAGSVLAGAKLAVLLGFVRFECPLSPFCEAGKERECPVASSWRARGDQPGVVSTELLSAADVARTIARIAHQIIEKTSFEPSNAADVVLLGLPTRGVPLDRRLAAAIAEFTGGAPGVGILDATLYRDDLRRRPARSLEPTALPDGGVDDRLVVLVDDVLFSGRTVRAALDALRDHGRPRAVQLAVLVDRGHRELPIRADYVGKNVPTARAEQIAVLLTEVDGRDAVLLRRPQEADRQGGTGRPGGTG